MADLLNCESCGKEFPVETMERMVDCWFCAGCYSDWKKVFDACQHEWEPFFDDHGDPGKYCNKCFGFVADETERGAS